MWAGKFVEVLIFYIKYVKDRFKGQEIPSNLILKKCWESIKHALLNEIVI